MFVSGGKVISIFNGRCARAFMLKKFLTEIVYSDIDVAYRAILTSFVDA